MVKRAATITSGQILDVLQAKQFKAPAHVMYHLFVLPESWPIPFGLHRECGFVPQRRAP